MEPAKRLHNVEEYYFSRKLREVQRLVAEGENIINMGIGSPDMPPAPEVVTALQEASLKPHAHQYQSYQGIPQLRQAMSAFYLRHFNVSLDFQTEILPLMGSKEGIMHLSLAFLNEGDEALIPNPGYPTYTSVTRLAGATPRYYALEEKNGWLPPIDWLEAQDLSKVKLLWLCYPHMPTGARASYKIFEKLVAFANSRNILLVNDNPYSFIQNTQPLSLLQVEGAKETALELNSLSKTFNMAGWRIGMLVGNAGSINAVLKVKSNMDSGMFYPLQCGAIAALQLPQSWLEQLNERYSMRKSLLLQLAHKLGCSYAADAVGMFVWAKLPAGAASEPFTDRLLYEKRIFAVPGTVFGTNGEGYIRFSLCVAEEKIEEAIKRI